MKSRSIFKAILVINLFYLSHTQATAQDVSLVPNVSWADSYSANGRCYIDSNFDHGIGNVVVATPIGGQSIQQIAQRIGSGPGRAGNPVYNDVQCGNGPANSAGDENQDQCPGRVDLGAAGCMTIGPKWDLATAYGTANQTNPVEGNACHASDRNLAIARKEFAAACPSADFRDCDPINGVWVCASAKVETLNLAQMGVVSSANTSNPTPTVSTTESPAGVSSSSGNTTLCYSIASTLQVAKRTYAEQCSAPRKDCDPVDGLWVCANEAIESVSNFNSGAPLIQSAIQSTAQPEITQAPTTEQPTSVPDNSAPISSSIKDPRNLLSLHYDCAPDKDDGHANVAGKVLADVFNIKPHVVVGAHGYELRSAYKAGCEPIFDAAWQSGTALTSGYVNAYQNQSNAINTTLNLWRKIINNGGQVYVAEGGPSDFTYEVVRRLSSSQRNRVTVVQHSIWNQNKTRTSSLNYVKNNTNYIKIDDGNSGGATADLNQKSASFVTRALNSRWQLAWSEAFAFLSPDEKLDFSDAVEFLYLLDIGRNVVASPNDFADRFFR